MATDARPQPIWNPDLPLARCRGERAACYEAFTDYLALGAGRSLSKLWRVYCEKPGADAALAEAVERWKARGALPPTRRFRTLAAWSTRWAWQARLHAEQDLLSLERQAKREEARRRAEDEGEADSDRVIAFLQAQLGDITREDAEAWLDARLKAERLRRLALGMPERIAQERLADSEGEPLEMPQIVFRPAEGAGDDDGAGG